MTPVQIPWWLPVLSVLACAAIWWRVARAERRIERPAQALRAAEEEAVREAEQLERQMYAELRMIARTRAARRRQARVVNPAGDVIEVHVREAPVGAALDEYLSRIGHPVAVPW